MIARGIFTSVSDLARKLRRYINAYSANARPFQWKYSDPTRRILSNEFTATVHSSRLLSVSDSSQQPEQNHAFPGPHPPGQKSAALARREKCSLLLGLFVPELKPHVCSHLHTANARSCPAHVSRRPPGHGGVSLLREIHGHKTFLDQTTLRKCTLADHSYRPWSRRAVPTLVHWRAPNNGDLAETSSFAQTAEQP